MRPKFRYRTMNCPARFPADLYLVDWLDAKGFDVDYITDHDLHAEGPDLLRPYSGRAVVVAPRILDGADARLARDVPRRGRPVHVHRRQLPLWRDIGASPKARTSSRCGAGGRRGRSRCRPVSAITRPPASRVASGRTAAAHRTRSSAWARPARASTAARRTGASEASYDPNVAWIFDGIEGDLIGDSPNLQVKWGAAGYEFDRVDYELGSPGTTVILGSSVRFNESSQDDDRRGALLHPGS